jgi:hypothetical protein
VAAMSHAAVTPPPIDRRRVVFMAACVLSWLR